MDSFLILVGYFTVYSFLGWLTETIWVSVKEKQFVNRGFLNGPFCPIYGFGVILILMISKWVDILYGDNITGLCITIILSLVALSALEYLTGFLLEKMFHCRWWNYSANPYNIDGFICLRCSLLWGLMSFVLIKIIHPAVEKLFFLIPTTLIRFAAILFILYFLTDTLQSISQLSNLRRLMLDHDNPIYIKLIKYIRFFSAFPKLLFIKSDKFRKHIRSGLYDKIDKVKNETGK